MHRNLVNDSDSQANRIKVLGTLNSQSMLFCKAISWHRSTASTYFTPSQVKLMVNKRTIMRRRFYELFLIKETNIWFLHLATKVKFKRVSILDLGRSFY